MKQINFFSPFIDKHYGRQKRSKLWIVNALILLIAAGVLGYNTYQIVQLNMKKADLNAYLNDPANQEAAKESHVRMESMALLDTYLTLAQPIKDSIEAAGIIDKAFLDKLSVAKVGVAAINGMNYDGTMMTFKCEAGNKLYAAEFLHRLKLLGLFKTVQITEMSQEYGSVEFEVRCVIEGGSANEAKQ